MDSYAYYALFFALFIFLAYRPLAKAIAFFLDEKITEIKWDVESAITSKEALEKELAEIKKDMPFVERKHKQMLESAQSEISENYNSKCLDFKVALKFTEENALQRIQQSEREALARVKSEMLEKSLSIVSKYFADQKNSDLDLAIISNSLNRHK